MGVFGRAVVLRFEREFRRRYGKVSLVVALLGAGGRGLRLRRRIKERLRRDGIVAVIPEDDFPSEIGFDVAERCMLGRGDVELVFINVESWGSATEFGGFYMDKRIAPKLRVLVNYAYHPLYGFSRSYLSNAYLTFMAVYGHVYAYGGAGGCSFPTASKVILKLARRYKEWKVIGKEIFIR